MTRANRFLIPNIVRAIGQAFVITPLAAITTGGIAPTDAGAASGLSNMLRNLGGAIGTPTLQTIITKREQYHSNIIGRAVNLNRDEIRDRIAGLTNYFLSHGISDIATAQHMAIVAIGSIVRRQALIMGFQRCLRRDRRDPGLGFDRRALCPQDHARRWCWRPMTSALNIFGGCEHRRRQPLHLGDMTMKVLCISKWATGPSPKERDAILPKEVRATLKLYLDGVIEQMWFKLDAPGVVFLVNAESVDAAKTHVHGLPMGQAGLMDFDFIPIGPLAPLGMLIAEK